MNSSFVACSPAAIFTTVCCHTFHCKCLGQWGGDSCPVCRYNQQVCPMCPLRLHVGGPRLSSRNEAPRRYNHRPSVNHDTSRGEAMHHRCRGWGSEAHKSQDCTNLPTLTRRITAAVACGADMQAVACVSAAGVKLPLASQVHVLV